MIGKLAFQGMASLKGSFSSSFWADCLWATSDGVSYVMGFPPARGRKELKFRDRTIAGKGRKSSSSTRELGLHWAMRQGESTRSGWGQPGVGAALQSSCPEVNDMTSWPPSAQQDKSQSHQWFISTTRLLTKVVTISNNKNTSLLKVEGKWQLQIANRNTLSPLHLLGGVHF